MTRPIAMFILAIGVTIAAGCGVEVGNPIKPTETGTQPSTGYITDNDALGEIIAGQLDATVAAAAQTDATEDADLRFAFTAEPTITRECKSTDPNYLAFERSFDGSFTKEVGRIPHVRVHDVVLTESITSEWTSDTANLFCRNDKKPRVDFASLNTLTVVTIFAKERSRSINLKRNGRVIKSGSVTASGEREVTFTKVGDSEIRQAITESATRTTSVTSARLGEITIVSSLSTTAPLIVTTSFAGGFANWQTRTIASGTMVAEHANGNVAEISYSDVVINRAEGCLPESGAISGRVFAVKADTEPTRTFTVTYADGQAVITFDNGESTTVEHDVCTD